MARTTITRATRRGIPGWLDEETGRWLPIMAGAEDPPDPTPDPDPAPEPARDPDPAPDPDPDPDPADPRAEDWRSHARRHERDAKKARREADDLRARLARYDEEHQTEHERAIETARREATDQVTSRYEQSRRADRLEVAVTRLAAKGITLGEGDDAKTVKFADPDDALVHLERAIAKGEIDDDDIFDADGRVQGPALTAALEELLDRKPHLAASTTNGATRRRPGSADGGKGSGSDSPSLEDMTPEEHAKRKGRVLA